MIKHLRLYGYRYCLVVCFGVFFTQQANAQTDADALMIPKNVFCAGLTYSNNSWTNYWEGTFKRDNANIGKLTTNTYSAMGNYGITNKLDVLVMVPYVTTNASEGTLKGQHGMQDLMVALKWMAVQTEIGKGIFSVHGILEGSLPLSNYEPDFDPVAIGLHDKSASGRVLVNYQTGRFFIAGAGQYTYRDDITIDRNSYFTTNSIVYSNRVDMPNASNILASAGYRSLKLNVEAIVQKSTDYGGFDIRKNDMPFPGNKMNMTTAGGLVKYSFLSGLEFTAQYNYVLAGRNVGQATTWSGSVFYLFDLSKKNKK